MIFGNAYSVYKTEEITIPKNMKEVQEKCFTAYDKMLNDHITEVQLYTKVMKAVLDLFKKKEYVKVYIKNYIVYLSNDELEFNIGISDTTKDFSFSYAFSPAVLLDFITVARKVYTSNILLTDLLQNLGKTLLGIYANEMQAIIAKKKI